MERKRVYGTDTFFASFFRDQYGSLHREARFRIITTMTENSVRDHAVVWLVDSETEMLAAAAHAFAQWGEYIYFRWDERAPDWENPPDAVFFSAEIPGGAGGEFFRNLVENAGPVPLIAVTRVRSLAQALAYFRAGAADYVSLPLGEEEARERFEASQERAARLAMQNMVMEVEQIDSDSGGDSGDGDEDILARVQPPSAPSAFLNTMPLDLPPRETERKQEREADADEPVAVDGLPIPTLWEELPCGLLVFDSLGNLVFSNRLGLELFGQDSLAGLQDALESNTASFAAYGANQRPFPDNQWPHVLAARTHVPRSAVLSIEQEKFFFLFMDLSSDY